MSKKSKILLGILRKKPHKNQKSLLKAWDDIDMCASSKNTHKRFEAVVEAEVGYIEKKLTFYKLLN
jgi:hypothetical protein